MKKKFLVVLITVSCVLSLIACSKKEENKTGVAKENVSTESQADVPSADTEKIDEMVTTEQTGEYEYPPEDNDSAVWESKIGYSMAYDPSVFTVNDVGEIDVFSYNTSENLDAPVYISVLQYTDMDAQSLADGLALQSGLDGVEVQDVYFGADNLETKCVYYEKEVDGVKQVETFYSIPKGDGALLVEIASYVGAPENVDAKFEEMLGTFSMK